jgi:hypothetical protein
MHRGRDEAVRRRERPFIEGGRRPFAEGGGRLSTGARLSMGGGRPSRKETIRRLSIVEGGRRSSKGEAVRPLSREAGGAFVEGGGHLEGGDSRNGGGGSLRFVGEPAVHLGEEAFRPSREGGGSLLRFVAQPALR